MTSTALSAPQLTIDGQRAGSADSLAVVNPATEEVFVEVPSATEAQLDQAVAAANRAAPAWRALPIAERQDIVRRYAAVIREHIDELARLLTLEQGKPLSRARGEIGSGLAYVESFCAMDLPVEVIRDDEQERLELRRVPVGVVAAITAWNYPQLLSLWKIGPALVAGNPVIVKPSPYTPVSTLRAGELAQQVLPPGLLQVLAGGDDLGRLITTHPGIRKISFTGSVRAGRSIMRASADTLKRLTLELGGNDAGIVLDDADPATIAADLYAGGMSNCGQVCAGLKRLYVPARRAAEYAEALTDVAAKVVVGNGLDDGVDMGPVQNGVQLARVKDLLARAQAAGGEVFCRGQAPEGPVLPLLTYDDVDEVVTRANASPFGLGASVWSSDIERATQVAKRLEAGSVWVNQHPALSPEAPFGGLKQSGIGVEAARDGLLAYTDISVLRVKRRS
jgi:acyl-CoA reductase-like NAD-dependent aldehyde dehydrogenase